MSRPRHPKASRYFWWRGRKRTDTFPSQWPKPKRNFTVRVSVDCYAKLALFADSQDITNKAALDAILWNAGPGLARAHGLPAARFSGVSGRRTAAPGDRHGRTQSDSPDVPRVPRGTP